MLQRITRSLIVFAVLVGAYQAYARLAAPLMEPPLAVRTASNSPHVSSGDPSADSVRRYQLLLRNYLGPEHWTQKLPPKVLANGEDEKVMLVVDDWKRRNEVIDDKNVVIVSIDRFALLIFPTPPREGVTPPPDAIILESERGALLQFDEFRPEMGKIGQISRGQFPGKITIRSDMREPGPDDDLLVETNDLEMNTKLLYTSVPNTPVKFRMGQNVGRGRELEIRFMPDEHARKSDSGLKIAGVESLEIRHGVQMRLELDTEGLLPGGEDSKENKQAAAVSEPSPSGKGQGEGALVSGNPPSSSGRGSVVEPSPNPSLQGRGEKSTLPVEVACSGPFSFDFLRYVASMDRDVELRQINPNGPADQMLCRQLDIHFAPKPLPGGATERLVGEPGERQRRDLGRLEPVAVVAMGHPVVIDSPARMENGRERQAAKAKGDRVELILREQRVRVTGVQEAQLVLGPNELRAPAIDYTHPPKNAATPIGKFRASGPGRLQYVPDLTKPQQVFQAAWQNSVDLSRENGQPVLFLDGRPQLAFGASGTLAADQMKIYLRELAGAEEGPGFAISSGGSGGKVQVIPDRLVAAGRVEVYSPQLTARTAELIAVFRLQPVAAATAGVATAPAAGTAAAGETPAASPVNQFGLAQDGGPAKQAFQIDSAKMRMDVNLQGQKATPTTVACEGDVVFREVPLVPGQEQPLEITGGQLTADRLETPTPHLLLQGAVPGRPGDRSLAKVVGRGVTMEVENIEGEVHARDIRTWSHGAGKATLMMTRDLLAGPTAPVAAAGAPAAPVPVEICWQGGLKFDGRTIHVERNVLVAGAEDNLRCDRLAGRLSTPIQVGTGAKIDEKTIDLTEVECHGHVSIEHRTRDAGGLTSFERVQLASLTINQQTGDVHGTGPGVIRSTQFGTGLQDLAGGPLTNLPLPPGEGRGEGESSSGNTPSKLHFLRVDFQDGLKGNLYLKTLDFIGRVATVYGPVDAWEQELDPRAPESLPPDAMTLTSDVLKLNEDPINKKPAVAANGQEPPIGYIQLTANGNVRIEGQIPKQGPFVAQADQARFDQFKDMFILQGNGRTPARLWRTGQGEPPAVGWIRYNRKTGKLEMGDIQYLELTPTDVESARRPTPVK